jgi:hypothetical protein
MSHLAINLRTRLPYGSLVVFCWDLLMLTTLSGVHYSGLFHLPGLLCIQIVHKLVSLVYKSA